MKTIACLFLLITALNAWAEEPEPTYSERAAKIKAVKLPEVTGDKGRVYKNVSVISWSDGDVKIMHETGTATLPVSAIPEPLQDDIRFAMILWAGKQMAQREAFRSQTATKDTKPDAYRIPGAKPVNTYLGLEQKGFKVTKRFGEVNEWTCSGGTALVMCNATVIGPSTDVEAMTAIVAMVSDASTTPDVAETGGFLGWLASLPYDGAEPQMIKSWVESHIKARVNTSKVVGGVKFNLIFKSRSTLLHIMPVAIASKVQ